MRIWHFSESGYPHLPPESEYESIRVTLPNRIYDPKVGAEIYRQRIDEWVVADEEGLEVMVNEHHQTPTSVMPAGAVMMGILARVTKRAQILILGNAAAYRDQPLRIAEEMAMIDVISKGRLNCGFVKGAPYEVASSNASPMYVAERMQEAYELIIKAWTTHDGPFTFEGRFFHHRAANIWPRPYQDPHPPVWFGSQSVSGAATCGERGAGLGVFLGGYQGTPGMFKAYREGWVRGGRGNQPFIDKIGCLALVYTGETDEEGRAGAQKLLRYLALTKVPQHFKNPPGFNPRAVAMRALRTGSTGHRDHGKPPDLDEEIAKGFVFCGSPDTVFNQLKKFYEHVGGFGNLFSMGQYGFLTHEETVKGIRLLAREVLPRLKELKPRQVAA